MRRTSAGGWVWARIDRTHASRWSGRPNTGTPTDTFLARSTDSTTGRRLLPRCGDRTPAADGSPRMEANSSLSSHASAAPIIASAALPRTARTGTPWSARWRVDASGGARGSPQITTSGSREGVSERTSRSPMMERMAASASQVVPFHTSSTTSAAPTSMDTSGSEATARSTSPLRFRRETAPGAHAARIGAGRSPSPASPRDSMASSGLPPKASTASAATSARTRTRSEYWYWTISQSTADASGIGR